MVRLSQEVLSQLPTDVVIPRYDRTKVTPGILHFGVGAFHRSHQALIIDRLLMQGLAQDWGIVGVGLLESDKRMLQALSPQDCLYTLITKHPDGKLHYQVIGSIIEYLFAPENPDAVLERLIDPAIRIVSLTITEGGYSFDRVTGEFDPTTPGVVEDLQGSHYPVSAFGYIVEGLRRRRANGTPAFTVQSCDNIQGNGEVAKKMIIEFAQRKDPELAEWISVNVVFPSSMVDRITPATAPADIELASKKLGVEDHWPVPCEPFLQWVLEDHFPTGRPPFEKAEVQMVADVMPYELMKLRLLNASHQGLCYFGRLSGYTYVHEVMGDPLIVTLLRRYMDEEATPTLSPVPGVDLKKYKDQLIERFSNPQVLDTVARLAAESSDRIPKWLLPVVREQLKVNGPVALSAAIVASWARYDEAIDEQGNPIEVVDPLRDELIAIAKTQRENPSAFIQNTKLFGDLGKNPFFVQPYLAVLNSLHVDGAQKTLREILS
jgi:mannitol 2-dehydrogenase